MTLPKLPERLADLAARARAWAQVRAAADPAQRVRLAWPLDAVAVPQAVAEILAGVGSGDWAGGAQPRAPWAPSLEAFQRQVSGCLRCPLGGKRRKFVFGEGSSTATLVFVGDAPGPEEDALGRPFAGAAGQLLDRMIAAMGFKRSDVYLANVLKCRSQSGREPDPADVEACRPYLEQQLALLAPKAVVSLGAFSSRLLLGPDLAWPQGRGRWGEHRGVAVMPTHHPNDLLKDPGLKRHVWDDLKLVMKRL